MPLPTLNVSALLPSLARLSLLGKPRESTTGSARGAQRALSPALDASTSGVAPKAARRASTKVCVGFVAVSRLYYKQKAALKKGADCLEGVLFIEEFFVNEDYRGKGVGRCLLAYVMSLEDQYTSKTAALIVRSKAPQQERARKLYRAMGFYPERLPAFVMGAGMELDPAQSDDPEVKEEYWDATLESHHGKCNLQEQDAAGHRRIKGTDIFLDCVRMDPEMFMNAYKPIVQLAEAHHTEEGGDHYAGAQEEEEDESVHRYESDDEDDNEPDDIPVMRDILEAVTLGVYGAFVYE